MWAAAETTVIIIGASIPFLRKLLREAFFKKTPASEGYVNSHDLDQWASHKTDVSSSTVAKPRDLEGGSHDSDDTSDKSILGEAKAHQAGILVTQQFTITRHGDTGAGKPDPNSKLAWN